MPENYGILGPGAGAVDIVLTVVETKKEGGVDRGDDLSVLWRAVCERVLGGIH